MELKNASVNQVLSMLTEHIEQHLSKPPQDINELRESFRKQSEAIIKESFKDRVEKASVDCWLPN
jgi:uncharacterized membrane protein YcaP (DUF421 family)